VAPDGRVSERGQPGTLGPLRADETSVQGIVLPRSVNGHTHLGDSVWTKEPPLLPFHQVVAPPHGLKHRLLSETPADEKRAAMARSLRTMGELGTAATLDFREEGLDGVRDLRSASGGTGVEPVILGRPREPLDRTEVRELLQEADGLGLSAFQDLPGGAALLAMEETRSAGKILALHASESAWEPIGPILELRPKLLVHLCFAEPQDLELVREAGVTVAVCPRSNALYGRSPPLAEMERRQVPLLLGTDNAMFQAADLFREMEYAYLSARARGDPVSPRTLVEAAFVTPWKFLGRPEHARLEPGSPTKAMILQLPPEDPYYQVAARGAHRHLLLPGGSGALPGSRD
jgi:cytosine/adenosine deaminase-related metal-dependent hydrolase